MAISTQKLLPSRKSASINSSIVKVSAESLSLNTFKKIKPTETPQEDKKIPKKLIGIENVIVSIRNLLKRREEKKRKDAFKKNQESDKAEKLKKEDVLEEKKSKSKTDKDGIEAPKIGIFDRIKKIVGLLFFGWLVNKFFKYIPQILGIVEQFIQTVEGIRKFLKPLTDAIYSGIKFVIVEGGKALAKIVGVKLDDKEKNLFVVVNELDKKLKFLDFLMGSMILYDIFDSLTEGMEGGMEKPEPRSKPKVKDPSAAAKNAYEDVIKSTRADAKTYGKRKLSWKDVQKISKKGQDALKKAGLSFNEREFVNRVIYKAETAASNARFGARSYDLRVKTRYEQRFGQRAARNRFTPEKILKKQRAIPKLIRGAKTGAYKMMPQGLRRGAFKLFGKGAKSLKMASGFMKRIPFLGSIVGLGIDMALGESFDRALAGAIGAGIGAWIGTPLGAAVFGLLGSIIPGLGTVIGLGIGSMLGAFIGGWIGDFLAKKIYELIKPKFVEIFKKAFPDFDLSPAGKEDEKSKTGGGGTPAGLSASSNPLSGDMNAKAKVIYDYIRSKGYSDIHAKGLVANIQRESEFRPGVSESGGPGVGLFQYSDNDRKPKFLKAVPDYKTNWKAQIDYALGEDVGPQYKGQQFANSAAAAYWWMHNWERSGDQSSDQGKHINFLNQYKFGSGGDVKKNNMATIMPGVTSPTSSSLATSPSIKFQPSYYGNKTYILPINTTVIAAVPSKNSSGGIYAEPSQSYTSLNTNNVYHMILQQ
jgi:hypothetical protein